MTSEDKIEIRQMMDEVMRKMLILMVVPRFDRVIAKMDRILEPKRRIYDN